MRRTVTLLGALAACLTLGSASALASDPPAAAHTPAPATPAAPKRPEPAAPAPAPRAASPARVDEVMGRVRQLIASYEREVLPERGPSAAAAKATRRPGSRPAESSRRARVALVWRASLVWPAELLDAPRPPTWPAAVVD